MSNIIGGINYGDNFFITTTIGGTYYFIASYMDDSEKDNKIKKYQFVTKEDDDNKFAVFTTSSSTSNGTVTIKDVNGGGLFKDSDDKFINSKDLSAIKYSQSKYQQWTGVPYLSNVGYKLDGSFRVMDKSEVKDNIIFLPINQYYVCSKGSPVTKGINTPAQALANWLTAVKGTESFSNSGWTNFDDCVDDYMYDYCPSGTGGICGTENCKGNCSEANHYCDYGSDGKYVCSETPNDYLTKEKWWKSKWFIFSVIAIILIGIAAALVIIFVYYHKKKSHPK